MLRAVERLGVVQIDSVNVLTRTHYLPLFSRLGAYDRGLLEQLAWGPRRALFEYWGHEASLMPWSVQPLLRWRMEEARAGVGVWGNVAKFMREHPAVLDAVLETVARRGPTTASELEIGEAGEGGWWGWSDAKRAAECLFWTGRLVARTRRSTFERVYDLPERALPKAVREAPTPDRAEAQRELVRIAARAQGIATVRDLRDWFRMSPEDGRAAVEALVSAGALERVAVKGWREEAFLHPEARTPRRVRGEALLSPFDNLIWFRPRTERIWGVRVRLEIYTPAEKRTHGYYVLPFLQDERITARVDLKSDRAAGVLRVQAAHAESGGDGATPARLAGELRRMSAWLGLGEVAVAPAGDLAGALGEALSAG